MEKKKTSVVSGLLYFIILPLIFTLVATFFLLSFVGFDFHQSMLKVANKIPVVASFVPDPKVDDVEQMKQELAKKGTKIQQLKEDIAKRDKLSAEAEKERIALTVQIEKLQAEIEEKAQSEVERLAKLKELAKLYESMTTKQAAEVLESMTIEKTALILSQMSSKGKSELFSKLSTSYTAELTDYYLESINYKTISVPLEMLTIMFESVEIADAAKMLENMVDTEDAFEIAVVYFNEIDQEKRDSYLAEMDKKSAKAYRDALTQ